MRLPHLMAQASRDWCGQYLFFLHVPKTAGTSFRLALTSSCGTPAVTLYRHIGEVDPSEYPRIAFWPLFIGHGHIDDFPEPHRGLTIVREPRSRYLSMYRQHQNSGRGPHLFDEEVRTRLAAVAEEALSMPFGGWLRAGLRRSSASYFSAGFKGKPERFIRTAPVNEVRDAVATGVSRIDAAAWSHDHVGMLHAITIATGDVKPQLPELNAYSQRRENTPQAITLADLTDLNECAARDQLLIDALVARGLIEPLSSSQADDLFHTTAERLGFRLP